MLVSIHLQIQLAPHILKLSIIFGHMKIFCFQVFSSKGDSVTRQVEFVVIGDDGKTGTDEASASNSKLMLEPHNLLFGI